jgi:hypothetical protein
MPGVHLTPANLGGKDAKVAVIFLLYWAITFSNTFGKGFCVNHFFRSMPSSETLINAKQTSSC